MKKIITLFFTLSLTLIGLAQVTKTINVIVPGTLEFQLTVNELANVSDLIITGTIDARDFVTMMDKMPKLTKVDISDVSISAYTGYDGPFDEPVAWVYPSNTIPAGAFSEDYILSKITFSSSITSIGDYAFQNCKRLTSVIIPSSVTSIKTGAFEGCSNMTFVTISSSVDAINESAFSGSSSIISVDANNPNYSSLDGVLFNKNKTILYFCPITKNGSFTIPSSVTTIGDSGFEDCSSVTSFIIPSSVTTIGYEAFGGCNSLTSIYVYGEKPPTGILGLNRTVLATCTLYVPLGCKNAYQADSEWNYFTHIVEKTTAIQIIDNERISLYPNPTISNLHVSGLGGTAILEMFGANGEMLLMNKVNDSKSISVENFPKGMYVVKIITDEGIVERKLIKK